MKQRTHLLSRFIFHLHVYFIQLKNNFVREAVYRTNFITMLVVDFMWMITEASLFSVIYSHTEKLGGWSIEQVYFFLGIFFASDALFTVFFARSFWQFSDLVNRGELDVILTKPVNTLFMAITRWVNFSAILNVALGFIVMLRYGEKAGFHGGLQWFTVFLWLMVGLLTQVLLRFAFSVWIFWTDRGWALARLYYQFFAIATKPHTLYPKAIRYLIMTALPFAFIGSFPAQALTQGLSLWEYAWVAIVISGFTISGLVLWNRGLRRYQSASS